MTEPIVDISKWQGQIDYDKFVNSGIFWAIVRASFGTYEDSRFQESKLGLAERAFPFGTYHFMDLYYYPEQCAELWAEQILSIPSSVSLLPGMDFYKDYMGIYHPTERTYHWLDVETYGIHGYPPAEVRNWIRRFLAEMDSFIPGLKIGIYTNYYTWRDFVGDMPELAERKLWIARYSQYPPIVPAPWQEWFLWQFSKSGDASQFGCSSRHIDLNRCALDEKDFLNWLYLADDEVELEQRVYALEARVQELEDRVTALENGGEDEEPLFCVTTVNLNLRTEPVDGEILDTIPKGEQVEVIRGDVFEDGNGGIWYKVKWNGIIGWAASWYLDCDGEGEPNPDPDPEPEPETKLMVVVGEKAVAFASVGVNDKGKPIIEKNVYAETGDPNLKKKHGEHLTVYKGVIESDGGDKWFKWANVDTHGYDALYVRKTVVSEVV